MTLSNVVLSRNVARRFTHWRCFSRYGAYAMNQDDRLGPYRLLRRLGEGGMGVVHLALDAHGRQVAVKVLRSEVAGDDVARRRLSREVETMRRARSPYIAEVVDADVTGQRPYIVTRYVPGRPLDEIIKQDGPMSVDALLRVAGGVAEALAAVHAAGVIHRDLKPGNVLMLDGEPVLIDFGIAQAVDATRLTQTGMFIGTPGYLAPEIIEGHEAGPEIDVHAWAGTLLYAATGQPPFGKGTLEMIFFNITSGKANINAAPAVIQPVLRAALQREPAKRPTAAELAKQISRLMPDSRGRRVPDEITTVPNIDETTGRPIAIQAQPKPSVTPPDPIVTPPVRSTGPQPPVSPPSVTPSPVIPSNQPADDFVSLLSDTPAAGEPGDPFPTVRVTGEDLRRAGLAPSGKIRPDETPIRYEPPTGPQRIASPAPPAVPSVPSASSASSAASAASAPAVSSAPSEGDIPTRMAPPQPVIPPPAWQTPAKPGERDVSPPAWQTPAKPGEGDVPTRRVRPEELRQSLPQQQFFEQAPEIYEMTPQVHQPHPVPFQQTVRVPPPMPVHPAAMPGALLQRSKAYGVAGALLLVLMTGLAVLAPLLMTVVALPLAILLRAADIAQPQLNARRPMAAAATDVVRVLGQPAALFKSIGITIALVPYALILGLPVTLLLTVFVRTMPALAALSWGIAVALWTVCAGPGVEGPSRQMRRTLASLLPNRTAAVGLAWGAGAAAAIVAAIAVASVMGVRTVGHLWGPIDILSIVQRLTELRNKAGI